MTPPWPQFITSVVDMTYFAFSSLSYLDGVDVVGRHWRELSATLLHPHMVRRWKKGKWDKMIALHCGRMEEQRTTTKQSFHFLTQALGSEPATEQQKQRHHRPPQDSETRNLSKKRTGRREGTPSVVILHNSYKIYKY